MLAANTAFADFPRLASIVARDGFLPRQFVSRGDRLVFSNGILMLAGLAIALLIVFRGDTSALIPLCAVGVFTGFTLSQTGMVRHHLKLKEPNWKRKAVVNGVGAVMTAVVLAVVVVSKFTIGAWVPVVMIPMVVLGFRMVSEHYRRVGEDLRPPVGYRPDVGETRSCCWWVVSIAAHSMRWPMPARSSRTTSMRCTCRLIPWPPSGCDGSGTSVGRGSHSR